MAPTHRCTATLDRDVERGGYVARAVEVASQGETLAGALENLLEALELLYAGGQSSDAPPPEVLVASVVFSR